MYNYFAMDEVCVYIYISIIKLVAHTNNSNSVVAMVNGCAHQRRREETRDREAPPGKELCKYTPTGERRRRI